MANEEPGPMTSQAQQMRETENGRGNRKRREMFEQRANLLFHLFVFLLGSKKNGMMWFFWGGVERQGNISSSETRWFNVLCTKYAKWWGL